MPAGPDVPSPEHLKTMMRSYFHRAYTLGDASVIDELIASDMLTHGLTPEPLTSRQEFKDWYTRFRSSFSDVTCPVTHAFVEGPWVTCRVLFSGTHTGAALGPPPTNRKVTITALILARVQNGQVVEGYNELNELSLLQQLGVIPAMPPK